MIEPEWMKFESTGRIADYLSYKGHMEGGATSSMIEKEEQGRSVAIYGADHSADGHGIISGPGGRI